LYSERDAAVSADRGNVLCKIYHKWAAVGFAGVVQMSGCKVIVAPRDSIMHAIFRVSSHVQHAGCMMPRLISSAPSLAAPQKCLRGKLEHLTEFGV
jgi:hypothetical protein